ncbi:hypothetical protein C6P45_005086 [Maudiozyma exigua]|uniref:DUF4187 domain-containing protein n=1 Tax=Maudiozyma exigua TaxID=34358 RepID=A0A9P6W9D4_MAUEX|nr:hypothetical protein C6P45_005086 [Kazachstania exigua]
MITDEMKKRRIETVMDKDTFDDSIEGHKTKKTKKEDTPVEEEEEGAVDPLEPNFIDTAKKENKIHVSERHQHHHHHDDKPIRPVEFISKRNNYSDNIKEYNIEKNINEEKFRRRNSIIEGEDKKINQWHRLQKIAFEKTGDAKIYKPGEDPRDFNVLWRGYVKVLNKAYKKLKSNNATTTNTTIDEKGNNAKDAEVIEDPPTKECEPDVTVIQEDPELELFDEMSTEEKIMKLNIFLRSEIYFCCYCGVTYNNEQELYEKCPGIKQEDHE